MSWLCVCLINAMFIQVSLRPNNPNMLIYLDVLFCYHDLSRFILYSFCFSPVLVTKKLELKLYVHKTFFYDFFSVED